MQTKPRGTTSHQLGWVLSKNKTKKQVLQRMWRSWNPCIDGGNVKQCSFYGRQYGGSSKNEIECYHF